MFQVEVFAVTLGPPMLNQSLVVISLSDVGAWLFNSSMMQWYCLGGRRFWYMLLTM